MANYENLFSLLSQHGAATRLSEATGISSGNISDWKKGRSSPKADALIKIADCFGCSVDYLLGRTENPSCISSDSVYNQVIGGTTVPVSAAASPVSVEELGQIKKYRALDLHGKKIVSTVLEEEYNRITEIQAPKYKGGLTGILMYDISYAAGTGEPLGDAGVPVRIEIPAEKVPEDAHCCVRVSGDSMEPAYHHGDIVFVQRQDELIREGEIGIFSLNGVGYIKRLGHGELLSLNPAYEPIPIHDYDDLRCQGRVLGRYESWKL